MQLNHLLNIIAQNTSQLTFAANCRCGNELAAMAYAFVERIQSLNITQPKVIVYSENDERLICCFLAIWHVGGMVIPAYAQQPSDQIMNLSHDTQADILITSRDRAAAFKDFAVNLLCYDDFFDGSDDTIYKENTAGPLVDDSAIASILFSSGSTGKPKGIMHSYASLLGFINNLTQLLLIDKNTVYLVAQPMGHIGVIAVTMSVLLAGGHAILMKRFVAEDYIALIRENKPSHLNLHTPLFNQLLSYPLERQWFANMKVCFAAGDSMAGTLPQQFSDVTGAKMTTGYGMTETGIPLVNRNPYGTYCDAIGMLLPAFMVEIRDEQDQVVAPNGIGEMWVKSSACMVGYWNNPALTKQVIQNGWVRTGDLARRDQQGCYWYYGRQSHAVPYGDHTVYPCLIEKTLLSLDVVKHAALIAINHCELYLFVTTTEQTCDKSFITQWLQQQLPLWLTIQNIHFIDHMPLNFTGKIDRLALKKIAKDV